MPNEAIGFRAVDGDDLAMLGEWMRRPHWRRWWGDPEAELEDIRAMVAGRDTTRPYLITLRGVPAGYIQVWFIDDNRDPASVADHPWLAELPPGTVGVDLSLADADRLSQGIGSAALRAFAERLRAEGHDVITIDPDPENARAVRAYTKAGFRPIPELEGHTRGALIMQYQSNGAESRP